MVCLGVPIWKENQLYEMNKIEIKGPDDELERIGIFLKNNHIEFKIVTDCVEEISSEIWFCLGILILDHMSHTWQENEHLFLMMLRYMGVAWRFVNN